MSETKGFDPYHKWLGIAPGEARTHYRLLGLRDFEDDHDVIQAAADRQMTYVKTFATGRNAAQSQKLLNELAAAKVCLLNLQRKSQYDAGLKRKENTPRPAAKRRSATAATSSRRASKAPPEREKSESTDEALTGLFAAASSPASTAGRSPNQGVRTEKKRSNSTTVMAIAGGAVVALVCLVAIIVVMSGGDTEPTAHVGGPVDVGRNGLGGGQITGQTDDGGDTDVDDEHNENGNSTGSGGLGERTVQKLVIEPIADQSVVPGCALRFKVAAQDGFGHELGLQYRLMNDADRGEINPINGQFQWQSRAEDRGQRFDVTVAVVDAQGNSAERSFAVHVKNELELPPNPVVWLSFDSDTVESFAEGKYFNDKTGNGLSGRMVGSPQLVPGVSGTAVACNAPEGYVVIPDDPRLRGGDGKTVTVAVWFKCPLEGGALASKFWDSGSKDWRLAAGAPDEIGELHVGFYGEARGNDYQLSGRSHVGRSIWHHAALVLDVPNTTLQLYADGKLAVEDRRIDGASSGKEGNVYLGAEFYFNRDFHWGPPVTLDDLIIYDRALSPEELEVVYLLGKSSVPTTTVDVTASVTGDKKVPATLPERPDVAPTPARVSAPSDDSLAAATAALRAELEDLFDSKESHRQLALAALLIDTAAAEKDDTERFAALSEARRLAVRNGDLTVALYAVERLAAAFDVDLVSLQVETLADIADAEENIVIGQAVLDNVEKTARNRADADTLKQLERIAGTVGRNARKRQAAEVVKNAESVRSRLEAFEALLQEANDVDGDPQETMFAKGLYEAAVVRDWIAALNHFLRSGREPFARLAIALAGVSIVSDGAARERELGDAFWQLAQARHKDAAVAELVVNCARHWYRRALPNLPDEEVKIVERRLWGLPGAETAVGPFEIRVNGLGGRSVIRPKKTSGKVGPIAGGLAGFIGDARLEYEALPEMYFACEMEIEFLQPTGRFDVGFGYDDNNWLGIDGATKCKVIPWDSGINGTWMSSSHTFAEGENRFRFTNYGTPTRHRFVVDGRERGASGSTARDLGLHLHCFDNTAVRVLYCELRPLNERDVPLVRQPLSSMRVEADAQSALNRYRQTAEYAARPLSNDPAPFVVATTGTPMVWIAPGEFRRVNGKDLPDTQVAVTHGFWIAQYELSQQEWGQLASTNPSRFRGSPLLPVDGMSFQMIRDFCQALTDREQRARRLPKNYVYRIPTEAEWEYACRAGSREPFSVDTNDVWHEGRAHCVVHEIGTSAPNAFGLYDMHGNVEEICADAFAKFSDTPPAQLTDPFVPLTSSRQKPVLRGGSCFRRDSECSSEWRHRHSSSGGAFRGFRIVLAPTPR